jgi:NTE family protein
VIRAALPEGWSDFPLWVVARDLGSGERVAFGKEGAPVTDLHRAVSASTAIPGLFAPVTIAGRRYGDAGASSPSNLDLVADAGLHAVVCINPFSGGAVDAKPRALVSRLARRFDRIVRERCDAELAAERLIVERAGTTVHVLHPSADDIAHFPWNAMDLGARPAVMRRARDTTIAHLGQPSSRVLVSLLREHRLEA